MLIQPNALRDFVAELFTRAGAAGAVAGEVAEHLVEANLKGHDSHGVGMIPRYAEAVAEGGLAVNQHVKIVMDTGPLLTLDGLTGGALTRGP